MRLRVIIDSNFLEQFESVRGLILDTGPSGFLGFWSGVMFPCPTDVIVVLVSNALLIQSAYLWNTGLLRFTIYDFKI